MYRTTRGAEQRRLQCLQDIQNLQEEIKLLQISNEKLNAVGLDDMSFTELASLGNMLDEGFRIVDEQLDNAHEEITTKRLFEYDLMGGDWTQRIEKEDLAYQSLLAGRRVALRNKAREFRLSPPETQPWRSDDPERLKLDIDSLEMEKERLRLFNQRMLGKELDGMSYSELFVFSFEISGAMMKVVSMKKIKRDEEMGKTKRPRPSVNKVYPLCFFFLNCKTVSLLLSLTISFSCSQRSQSPQVLFARDNTRRLDIVLFNKSVLILVSHLTYFVLLQNYTQLGTTKGLNGLSYSELASIKNMLNQGLVVVEEQTDKVVPPYLLFQAYCDFATMQIVESDVMGMDWTDKLEKEDLAYQARLSRRRTAVRNKSRELRLSPQDSQQKHGHDHEELMLTIESLKIEKKRLLLLSQRMIGKEIDGMSYAELYVLGFDITRALMNVMQEMDKIKHAARVSKFFSLLAMNPDGFPTGNLSTTGKEFVGRSTADDQVESLKEAMSNINLADLTQEELRDLHKKLLSFHEKLAQRAEVCIASGSLHASDKLLQ
ncbi:unnamed protein product [Brassica rapa]|uniref:Uncharacterized protein n=1 Tax=Brassica campestris TaxID=3711 RepID=A0A8D9MDI0_BRACM|nr:unnamed protein product [Brassica rapa]